MKINYLFTLALSTLSSLAWADTDISDLYLQNAGFDDETHFDYRISDQGNVAQEILSIYGWTKDFSVDYTVCGIYEFGTAKTFNTYGKVPSAGYQNSKGGCLALSTGWDQAMKFYQTVTLPAGNYKLQTAYYNGSNSNDGYSLLGWLPDNGDAKVSSMSSFPSNQWKVDEVTFSLNKETTGRIQIGFKAVANGSANSAKIVSDFVKLYMVGDGSANYLADVVAKRVEVANELLAKRMNATHRKNLETATKEAESWIASPSTQSLSTIVSNLRKATEAAKKSMKEINIKGSTIPHEVLGNFKSASVLLKPASAGTGVIAGGAVRAVVEIVGIKDIRTKALRSNNPCNVVRATVAGLAALRDAEQVAAVRGKTAKEIIG